MCLETEFGAVFGEASPLSGYGDDCIERAEEELHSLRASTLLDVLGKLRDQSRAAEQSDDGSGGGRSLQERLLATVQMAVAHLQSPSARFCVEMLLLDALSRACARPVYQLLNEGVQARVLRTSAVLDPFSQDLRSQVLSLIDRGVTTFKLKCGQDTDRELAALAELANLSTPELELRIRLDPNGAWENEDLEPFVNATRSLHLEWVEDLSAQPAEWSRLRQGHPDLPLAIDEGLLRADAGVEVLKSSGATFVVLKPMALGGFSRALEWTRRANDLNLAVCVSHLFDGPIAFDAVAQLAFAVQTAGVVPGLGRHAALAGWSTEFGLPRSLQGDLLCPDGSSFGS